MAVLRIDIVRALDELIIQEDGMRFQGLAVALGKMRWPELIPRQRKKDNGLDAYAPASQTPEKIGKGLSASITPTLGKISKDATKAKEAYKDLKAILFYTPGIVHNLDQRRWIESIQQNHGLELLILEREEIITQLMMPANASLCASHLYLEIHAEPEIADLIERIKRAADAITQTWAGKTKGHPLIRLTAMRLDPNGAESHDMLTLEQIDRTMSQSGRIVLEGAAGRGKTTTLIQIAQRPRTAGIPFIIELPAWTSSDRGILEFIAGMPAFQAEGLTGVHLARVQQSEPFLFLLNGWNEIAESNSMRANDRLRELEREFPSAGIIVATRTHHLKPPLPGAIGLRLLPLRRAQRTAYLTERLGEKSAVLRSRIESDPSLDELTLTPFILSEVTSLFEAGVDIPSTKIGVLAEVLRLQEQRDEHRNALQTVPIFGLQTEYLKALATEMTRRSAVALQETEARSVVNVVTRNLADRGQIEQVAAPAILATLTAHHVLERVDYPQTAFQFEHQQLQEYYAAIEVRERLLDLQDHGVEAVGSFSAAYVNDPAWTEPLRMIAETFAKQTGDTGIDKSNTRAGVMLVKMALAVDLVFAGELAYLCGAAVWNEVRAVVGQRFRTVYSIWQQHALAAMFATGADDFSDIIAPILSGQDQQARLRTYRLWPDIQTSSIGPNWREQVSSWSEEARADFVAELLQHRVEVEVAAFATEDNSILVKNAAASGLMWTQSDDAFIRVLGSMDSQTFDEVACKNADRMPIALRSKTVAATRKFLDSTTDHPTRLRTVLNLIELGETDLEGIIKDLMTAIPAAEVGKLGSYYIRPALEYLCKTDPAWASEWVATQVADNNLYDYESWLPFATAIPIGLVDTYLRRLETENSQNRSFRGIIALIIANADAKLAARIFAKVRELKNKVNAETRQRNDFEEQIIRQLETLFRNLPHEFAAAGILSSVTTNDILDIKVAAALLSRAARSDEQSLCILDEEIKAQLLAYLKSNVDLVLLQDDFDGDEKAYLVSSIAQVGDAKDTPDLMRLIRADIERVRRNHGRTGWAHWNIDSVKQMDPVGAEQMLIDLLPEPEYLLEVAPAMSSDFVPKSEWQFDRTFRYDLMWAAREDHILPPNDKRQTRFATAINAEILRLQEQQQNRIRDASINELAKALAAIDGRGYMNAVLDVITSSNQWDIYTHLEIAERLLLAGVVIPANITFGLVDFILGRNGKWLQDSDRYYLRRSLALCPFVDDPAAGIAKIRQVLKEVKLYGHEMREIVTALGESRSEMAVILLYELATDASVFDQCQDSFINAFAALKTPRACELLLSFVDPDINGLALTHYSHRAELLVSRITELAQQRPEVEARLRELSERDLSELNRHLLSKVLAELGTHEALIANLKLIDDSKTPPVPQGLWDQLSDAFIERRSYRQDANVFTQHPRASNELRLQLFRIANEDEKRRKAALMLLEQIEEWRIEYGRPIGEPRHPDLLSGKSWPPTEPFPFQD